MSILLTVSPDLLKAHVQSYTRKDGAFVKEHDDGRQAAAPKAVHSDHAFDQIKAAGGQNVRTSSSGIHYVHKDGAKMLPHKDAPDGNRYVDENELKRHITDMGHGEKPAAAAPKPAKAPRKPKADPYGHPNVVGKPSKMVNYQWSKGTGSKEVPHAGKPTDAQEIHFLGKRYSRSSSTGTSMHDDTPVRRYHEDDGTDEGGHRVWLDDSGRVHADGATEVPKLRAAYEASQKAGSKK